MLDFSLATDLLVAALVGLAVGIEREWSGHTTGPDGRFAGARTFTLLGTIGGLGGWFLRLEQPVLAAAALGVGVLFPAVAYAAAQRRPGTTSDGTTEVVAAVVVLLGASAGLGNRTVASAAAAIIVMLLAEKSAVQQVLQRVAANEMRAALQFAVLALVILPLLPNDGYGPYAAFRPRQLWIVVLLFSGLNFAGYVARRIVGETRGLGVTGLLGGLVSSTAVALTFSRRSREDPTLALPLALGVVAACTVLVPRLLFICTMLQPAVALAAVPVLTPIFVAGAIVVGLAIWRERETRPPNAPAAASGTEGGAVPAAHGAATSTANPLRLMSALQMAIAFQLVLFAVAWVQRQAGTTGILTTATLLGLTDVDALTVSMTRYGAEPAHVRVAAAAIGIGVLSNTAIKLSLVLALGAPRYRPRAAAGLLILAVGSGIGLALGWP
jgi:uncharacterized membrane protein (DUF4010 family)